MADIKKPHAPARTVEGDGISYRGIIWFVIVLAIVTVTCQVLIWVLLRTMQTQPQDAQAQPVPLAPAAAARQAAGGRVYPEMVAIGQPNGPAPQLLVKEPDNLAVLRTREHEILTTYGVADKDAGTYRIPIERAKALILERGLPVRGPVASPAPATGKGKRP